MKEEWVNEGGGGKWMRRGGVRGEWIKEGGVGK